MKFGTLEILLLGLGATVLTLIALWVREELLDWWTTRHYRQEERRRKARARRKTG